MTIMNVNNLIEDFKAVVASVTPSQLEILRSLHAVAAERIAELESEIEVESSNDTAS